MNDHSLRQFDRKPLYAAVLGTVVAVSPAAALAAALEMLDPVLVTTRQVEAVAEIRVLGSVGRIT